MQPTARCRFAQGLIDLRGIAALVAVYSAEVERVERGNRRLIDRPVKLSPARLQLNSRISEIGQNGSRIRLSIEGTVESYQLPHINTSDNHHEDYDFVVIAASVQAINSQFKILLNCLNPLTPYVERHITHFTSPNRISHEFFNQAFICDIPDLIYATDSEVFYPLPFFCISVASNSRGGDSHSLPRPVNLYNDRLSDISYR